MGSDIRPMLPAVSHQSNTASSVVVDSLHDMAYDKAGDAARLKALFERIVEGRGESRAEFGRRSGLGKAPNVGHYLNGKNNLTIESARKFAAAMSCKIEDFSLYWARMAHASGQVAVSEKSSPHSYGDDQHASAIRTNHVSENAAHYQTPSLKLPSLSWGQIGLMSEYNEALVGMVEVEFVEADEDQLGPRAKFVAMPDDSMAPLIQQGDRLTLEPDWDPEPGEVVLVRDSAGEHYIRRYKHVRKGQFVAEPVNNTDYVALDSSVGLEVVAVVVARRQLLAKRMR